MTWGPRKVKDLYDYRREFRAMHPAMLAAVIECARAVQRDRRRGEESLADTEAILHVEGDPEFARRQEAGR
jgi:hypothetical protein